MGVRVVILRPGKAPETTEIEPTLPTMQKLVGGFVDAWKLFDRVSILFNEEGRVRGLPTCCYVEPIGDTVVGPAIISGLDADGEPMSLSDEDIETAMKLVTPRVFTSRDRGSA